MCVCGSCNARSFHAFRIYFTTAFCFFFCEIIRLIVGCLAGAAFILFFLFIATFAAKYAEHATASLLFAFAAFNAGYGGDWLRLAFAGAFRRNAREAYGVRLQWNWPIAIEAWCAPAWENKKPNTTLVNWKYCSCTYEREKKNYSSKNHALNKKRRNDKIRAHSLLKTLPNAWNTIVYM